MALATTVFASASDSAVALQASETFNSLPQTSAAQAIAYLNQQREANGIPGGLANELAGDEGCFEYTNLYHGPPGASPYADPHLGEVPGRPGYTAAGNACITSSDAGGGIGEWSATINPWWNAPLHITSLFDPSATTAWYGETYHRWGVFGQATMGTGSGRSFAAPAFFSLPGNGVANVAPSQTVEGELPFAPGDAVGLPEGRRTGPYITLWPEGTSASLQVASLQGANGSRVAVKVVTPATPAPPSPPGWPSAGTMGFYSRGADYVIPVHPLNPSSAYILTVTWRDPAGLTYTQVVHFSTTSAAQATREEDIRENNCPTTVCGHGALSFRTTGHSVRITGSPVAGQKLHVEVNEGYPVCVLPTRPCPMGATKYLYDVHVVHVLKLGKPTFVVPIPSPRRGDHYLDIAVTFSRFEALGYQWQPNTLEKTWRIGGR